MCDFWSVVQKKCRLWPDSELLLLSVFEMLFSRRLSNAGYSQDSASEEGSDDNSTSVEEEDGEFNANEEDGKTCLSHSIHSEHSHC